MWIRRKLGPVIVFSFFCAVGHAENRQKEGERLISHALELMNIRAAGVSPFRLKSNIQLRGGVEGSGTFTEIWISQQKWRRETEIGTFRRIEVGSGEKQWQLESGTAQSRPVFSAVALDPRMLSDQLKVNRPNVKRIDDKTVEGKNVRCVELEEKLQRQEFCVNRSDGTLLSDEAVTQITGARTAYQYGNYQKFGDHLYPRSIDYRGARGEVFHADIVELGSYFSADASVFEAPPGGTELGNCLPSEMVHPDAEYSPQPEFPMERPEKLQLVIVSLIVGSDGAPRNLEIARGAGAAFDGAAINAVQQWRFKPALCHGQPVPAKINVQVTFNRR